MDYKKMQFVGVLASNAEVAEYMDDPEKRSVFVNNTGEIQFLIKMVSVTPKQDETLSSHYYTGYLNCIENSVFDDNLNMHYMDREQEFIDYIKDYLFIFSFQERNGYKNIDKARIVPKIPNYTKDTKFYSVPAFSPKSRTIEWENKYRIKLNRLYDDYNSFAKYIFEKRAIGKVEWYEAESNTPQMIFWISENCELEAIGPFEASRYAYSGYTLLFNNLRKLELNELQSENCIYDEKYNPTLIHVAEETYSELVQTLLDKGGDEFNIESIKEKGIELNTEQAINEVQEENKIDDSKVKTEQNLIERFKYYTQKMNGLNPLYYDIKDLINFHTSVKTGTLTILSGMSGTGKSRLVDAYARALGISEDSGNVLILPVRPSWNDDSDLLGHVDLIHMVYRPSDSGFVKLLVDASEHKEKLYIVCFDEMNLARVEHYFSQFLSILEKPVGQRKLRLYDFEFKGKLYNWAAYPDEIEIHDNILFIGTVNIDESTHHFSDKVLDRSNVIKLKVLNFTEWKTDNFGVIPPQNWAYEDYYNLRNQSQTGMAMIYKQFLWELHTKLQDVSANIGVGPRIVKQIETYMENLPESGKQYTIPYGYAFDLQIVQRVITKIRGSEEQYSELLGIKMVNNYKTIFDFLDDYREVSEFTETRAALEQKKKELRLYGYCL